MDKHTAEKLISKTRDDYNLIADQFASTRRFNWGDFTTALLSIPLPEKAKVLDLGCGNGRVSELFPDKKIAYFGLDISEELIKHASARVPNGHFATGDMLATPYKSNEFDLVLSAATLHHIPSRVAREQAISEMYRLAKPGGYILITVWYFWNKPHFVRDIMSALPQSFVGNAKLDPGDFMMPWKNGNGEKLTSRYFHAWTKTELSAALRKSGFIETKVSFYFKSNKKIGNNLIAIARKPE